MSDLISRQAAIDALGEKPLAWEQGEYEEGLQTQWESDVEAIKVLPSAQPEPCEDAVNRETLLKFFDDWMSVLDENCHNQSVSDLKIIKRDFANLPPVTPKQRTGKWIHVSEEMWKCDQCGEISCCSPNFCPDCGADMRGGEDG